MPEPQDLHIDRALTNLSVQYRNEEFIWPAIMPVVKVGKRSDKFFVYDKDQRFRLPNDALSANARPNTVGLIKTEDNYSVEDHGLSDWVSREEEQNADTPLSPRMDANDLVNELLDLAQEKRVVDTVFNAATYPTPNKVQLSGTAQWGGSADDPIGDIMTGLDTAFLRPNTIVFGAESWTKFRQLPEILDAVKTSTRQQSSPGGLAMRSEVAALFEVDHVLVGRSKHNTAKEGQAGVFQRLWGKHCSLIRVVPNPTKRSVTFGVTFSELGRQTFTFFDGTRGAKGSTYIKTAWNSDEKIIASDLGYYIQDAVA